MAAPIVETIWLVNGFKRHIVMAAPIAVTAHSSVQNLKKSSSRRFDGKSRSLDDRDYIGRGVSRAQYDIFFKDPHIFPYYPSKCLHNEFILPMILPVKAWFKL